MTNKKKETQMQMPIDLDRRATITMEELSTLTGLSIRQLRMAADRGRLPTIQLVHRGTRLVSADVARRLRAELAAQEQEEVAR